MDHREWEDCLKKLREIVSNEVIASENRWATMAFPTIMDHIESVRKDIHELKMEIRDLQRQLNR